MADKRETLEQFAKIIKEQGMISAVVYDTLRTEKPSRRTLYNLFGKWRDALTEAVNYLADNGEEIKVNAEQIVVDNSVAEAEKQVRKLQQQVQELTRHIQTPKLRLGGATHKFGYVTDTHLGSLYADKALLDYAYDVFEKEGAQTVYHSGDLVDGQKMFRGQEYELEVVGSDAQVALVCDVYPKKPGITTYFITGNHDRSFWKDGGNDIGYKIAKERKDMVYLGHQESDIGIGSGDAQATIRLFHPDGGSAYAISYISQRYIAELPSGTKPDLCLLGHFHKAEKLFYRGVCVIQGGTLQNQTPYMRGKKISAAMGFWLVEVTVAPERVIKVTSTFYPVRT
jgi:predicted phosphodiesterase